MQENSNRYVLFYKLVRKKTNKILQFFIETFRRHNTQRFGAGGVDGTEFETHCKLTLITARRSKP